MTMKVKLQIATDGTPPLSVLATAKVASISVTVAPCLLSGSPPVIVATGWPKVEGIDHILRWFSWKGAARNLFDRGANPEGHKIYLWLEDLKTRFSGSDYEGACKYTNDYLKHRRTFLVGDCLSLADLVLWSYLAGAGKRWESLMESGKYRAMARWYNRVTTQYALDQLRATYLATYSKEKDSKTTEEEQGLVPNKQTTTPSGKKNNRPELGKLDEDEDLVGMLKTLTESLEDVAAMTLEVRCKSCKDNENITSILRRKLQEKDPEINRLKQRIAELATQKNRPISFVCITCMVSKPEVLCKPCRHLSLCKTCSVNATVCPRCHIAIEEKITVHTLFGNE